MGKNLVQIVIPSMGEDEVIEVEAGNSVIFVGANGSGKTRLAVYIEEKLGEKSHRISAHRALSLNPDVQKIKGERALQGLRFGFQDIAGNGLQYRIGQRWKKKAATSMLSDYDYVIQALFAEQSQTTFNTHKEARSGNNVIPEATLFERIQSIWDSLLPHRKLVVEGDDIHASVQGPDAAPYSASELSDGERSIFYLIAQSLLAIDNCVLIFDEPELHLHPSIMSKLWDEIEAARPDCVFIFITHDLEFAANRNAQKYVVSDFSNTPRPTWLIEKVPEGTGFSEEINTLILGSRKPILFVEGTETSLDLSLYRHCFPDWTIIPKNSCSAVVQAVKTFRNNPEFTRVTCSGVVDRDAYTEDERQAFTAMGICVLPVSEIENLFLLPVVVAELLKLENFKNDEIEQKIDDLKNRLFQFVDDETKLLKAQIEYCQRRVDRALKKVDFSTARTVEEASTQYSSQVEGIDINQLADDFIRNLRVAIEEQNLVGVLELYGNKGMLQIAASTIRNTNISSFKAWLVRLLQAEKSTDLMQVVRTLIPNPDAT